MAVIYYNFICKDILMKQSELVYTQETLLELKKLAEDIL